VVDAAPPQPIDQAHVVQELQPLPSPAATTDAPRDRRARTAPRGRSADTAGGPTSPAHRPWTPARTATPTRPPPSATANPAARPEATRPPTSDGREHRADHPPAIRKNARSHVPSHDVVRPRRRRLGLVRSGDARQTCP
jgi:hypothetical protein